MLYEVITAFAGADPAARVADYLDEVRATAEATAMAKPIALLPA